ncbi:MAG TPA: proline dehydrogenase family protein [Verrucomicrobiae bacterium]|jgi:proline dehydrogenase|nr:proline dehydrogenase family protein [Verrucomicrobiae bacterium]
MALMRSMLLAASQNAWLREHAVNFPFVRRSVSRFMPGETLDAAIAAAQSLLQKNIGSIFTHLGENVTDGAEARNVSDHYLEVLDCIHQVNLSTEVSVKLTQLGLDLSPDVCFENLERIIQREHSNRTVWVDMEASNYVDATLDIYKRAIRGYPNTGICLQAYLYRTKKDLAELLPLRPSIRLVKGAYKEPAEIAFPRKSDVDANYFALAQEMLRARSAGTCARGAFGTHDIQLIRRLTDYVAEQGISKADFEVEMLYGIQRVEQERLAKSGYRSVVLVAYGTYWYPWFVRRLAERPANVWFLLRNVFAS